MAFLADGTPIMFFNICWHKYYNGPDPNDKTESGHGYFSDQGKDYGEECYAFCENDGKLYFHGPNAEDKDIDLANLGQSDGADFIDGVTIVFVSSEPRTKNRCIVGWYRQARLYRQFQPWPDNTRLNQDGGIWHYNAVTNAGNGFLVKGAKRMNFPFPKHFRSTWYADGDKKICQDVHDYILKCENEREAEPMSPIVRRKNKNAVASAGHNLDPMERRRIEDISMAIVTEHYRDKLHYDTENVSPYGKGWDIEASRAGENIKVEVKGTKSDQVSFELTPNEFAMLKKYTSDYRIAVVTSCLEQPELTIFTIQDKGGTFEGHAGDRVLTLQERQGAIGKIVK